MAGPTHGGKKAGDWYDDFVQYAADPKFRDNTEYAGWSVPVAWMVEQIGKYLNLPPAWVDQQLDAHKDKLKDAPPFIFIVTRPDGGKYGQLVDPTGSKHNPNAYRLWIRGFRNPESFLEDIPPIQYP